MSVMNLMRPVVLLAALAAPAAAQTPVSVSDIQRLQDQVYDAGNEISRLRARDQPTADRLQVRLDDLRDEVIYLKVKLRKEGAVARGEYNDVRGRVESVRADARAWPAGDAGAATAPTPWPATAPLPQAAPKRNDVPAGTELDVRLERQLSSDTAQVEDRVMATTLADLYQGNAVLIPAGSTLRGVVTSVTKATRTDRKGTLTLLFDQITINGRVYPTRATVTQAIESAGIRGEIGKIGAGAGVGAILGGILGGAKGALVGVIIGGGGTIAATEGKDVTLPPGAVLRVRLEEALTVK